MSSFNRQVCFNELSFLDKDDEEDAILLFSSYAKTIKALKAKGFNGIRYEHGIASLSKENLRNIFDLQSNKKYRDSFLFIISTARSPYIEQDTQAEERYINEDFEVEVDDEWCVGQGFTAAYLLDTIVISLNTHPKWKKSSYVIRNTQDERKTGEVLNVVTPESLETDAIHLFIEQRTPLNLEKCNMLPERKSCNFRKDHGIDKLTSLWNRLRNCEFIISAINSLEFNPSGKEFIEKCCDDGKIHIRLVGTDAGYGMVIQTTGKNKRETTAIGEIIMQKYF